MRNGLLLFVLAGVSLLTSVAAFGQHGHREEIALDPEAIAFVEKAREATRPFAELQAAIAAGYRPIGPDMPNMGEHWVNPRLASRLEIVPEEPAFLTYLRVDGKPVLTGVAYTAPVLEGEEAPEPPVPGVAWHFHSGTVEEELLGHGAHGMSEGGSDRVRLAMLHAWIWTENPDGVFTADNWALPFVRLGLGVPRDVSPEAARAVYLLDGGVEYFADLAALAGLDDHRREELRGILDRHAGQIKVLVQANPAGVPIQALAAEWDRLWSAVRSQVGEEMWGKLRRIAE